MVGQLNVSVLERDGWCGGWTRCLADVPVGTASDGEACFVIAETESVGA
jgi:hypothetical protein